jgi:glycosyltransferase involved in cell wall biosynthesis
MIETGNDQYDVVVSSAAEHDYADDPLTAAQTGSTLDLTAFVSCYNEADSILQTLDTIRDALHELNLSFEVLVTDDRSTDRSFELVRAYIQAHPQERIVLRRNRINKGLAQNYIDGAFLGQGQYYKLFCGDNPEPKDSIVEVCRCLGVADMVIPRYSESEGKSAFRKALSKAYTFLVNLVSGNRISYYNGLAVHLRYNIMRWHPNTRGFGFQADIICMLLDQGATYREIEVPNIHRAGGTALSGRQVFSVLHTLLDLAIRRVANWLYQKKGTVVGQGVASKNAPAPCASFAANELKKAS